MQEVETLKGKEMFLLAKAQGRQNTEGDHNIFIGKDAGSNNKKGGQNILIGNQAGQALNYNGTDTSKGKNNIFIGDSVAQTANEGGISADGSYQLNIGNLIFGKMPSSAPTRPKLFFHRNCHQ